MKALLIDPSTPSNLVTEIEINDDGYTGIQEAIGCNCFTGIPSDEFGEDNVGYIDDEGLINGSARTIGVFAVRDYNSPLAGRGVILGLDHETGESKDVTITAKELEKRIGIWTTLGPIFNAR